MHVNELEIYKKVSARRCEGDEGDVRYLSEQHYYLHAAPIVGLFLVSLVTSGSRCQNHRCCL